jgi:hypothetical protein
VPAGVDEPAPAVSETVTETVLDPFTFTDVGLRVTVAEVLRGFTV